LGDRVQHPFCRYPQPFSKPNPLSGGCLVGRGDPLSDALGKAPVRRGHDPGADNEGPGDAQR
jgi:hypothetical protein